MALSLSSTSTRTFVILPAVALAETALVRRRMRAAYFPLLAAGWLQYRLSGRYRTRHGGGGPGMKNPPKRLVTTGVYSITRNPMYLGHLVFLTGLTLATRSRCAAGATVAMVPWFDARARQDEERLLALFGDDYARYRAAVPRWLGQPPARLCPERNREVQDRPLMGEE